MTYLFPNLGSLLLDITAVVMIRPVPLPMCYLAHLVSILIKKSTTGRIPDALIILM